ncbi:MAG: hypothetical protein CMM93_01110 [Rickettsiales bacterium]|nr:hypothetical protein [Rickettsiales bacterium]|tara:strand:- start:24 stop:983 length:960 start_codon:yes stop_codon:yes gene_type:complete
MDVVVTGASGFVGSHACRYLHAAGHSVTAVMRDSSVAPELPCPIARITRLDAGTDWYDILNGKDAVLHAAARVHVLADNEDNTLRDFRRTNAKATEHLARMAAKCGVKRFVFVSTIGVLGNYSVAPFTEEKAPMPCNAYSISKCEAEEALRKVAEDTGLEVVILRPPLVYGPGVKANFYKLMRAIYKEIPLPFGVAENARHFVSITNFCSLITLALTHPKARGHTYLVADTEAISTHDLILRLADYMNKRPRLIPVPLLLLRLGALLLKKERMFYSICSSLQIDTSKAQRELGWQPVQPLEEGLQETVHWFMEQQQEKS